MSINVIQYVQSLQKHMPLGRSAFGSSAASSCFHWHGSQHGCQHGCQHVCQYGCQMLSTWLSYVVICCHWKDTFSVSSKGSSTVSKRESINSFRLRSSPHRKAEVFLDPRSPGQFVGSNWATIDTVQTNQTTLSAQPPHIIFMRISSIEFVCCCFSPTYLMSHPCSVVSANNMS